MQTTMKKILLLTTVLAAISCSNDLPENYGQVQPILYLGEGEKQPLVVGLGGSEGGNPWASDRWKPTRE